MGGRWTHLGPGAEGGEERGEPEPEGSKGKSLQCLVLPLLLGGQQDVGLGVQVEACQHHDGVVKVVLCGCREVIG